MQKVRAIFSIISILSLALTTSGCTVFLPIAATTTAGAVAMSDRSTGEVVEDSAIVTKAKTEFAKVEYNNLLTKISINSYERRVMLTGLVKSQEYVDQAEKILWSIHGVREVINELKVGQTPQNKALDLIISSKIKTKFLLEKNFDSLNYSYDVSDQVVYLIGVARDEEELDRATEIAGSVSSVEKVVNHAILKADSRRNK